MPCTGIMSCAAQTRLSPSMLLRTYCTDDPAHAEMPKERRTSASSASLGARSFVTLPGAVSTKPSPDLAPLVTDQPEPTFEARLGSLSPFFLNWLKVLPCHSGGAPCVGCFAWSLGRERLCVAHRQQVEVARYRHVP